MRPNCLIIAGEKSGEEHCLGFLTDLKRLCPTVSFWGVGGDRMVKEGVELIYHLRDFSSWGFSDVFLKIFFYYKALRKITREVIKRHCKVAILIDFQGFNMRLAKYLKKKNISVLYYVAPQAWAWKEWRCQVLKKTVHTLFTIIPFEKEWFLKKGIPRVISAPHPYTFQFQKNNKIRQHPPKTLLVLPGSRNSEVEYILPVFSQVVMKLKKKYPIKAIMVCSSNVDTAYFDTSVIDEMIPDTQLQYALDQTDICLAASGTVTLAAALFEIPTIVGYKVSLFNRILMDVLIDYKGFISLPNIIHQKEIFPEFYQDEMSVYNIHKKIWSWIESSEEYNSVKSKLSGTRNLLTGDHTPVADHMKKVLDDVY